MLDPKYHFAWPGFDNMGWMLPVYTSEASNLIFSSRRGVWWGMVSPWFSDENDDGNVVVKFRASWIRVSSNAGESALRLGTFPTVEDAKQAVFTALGEWYGPNPIQNRADLPRFLSRPSVDGGKHYE